MNSVLTVAAQTSFRAVAVLPAILLLVFAAIWLRDRAKGGFVAEQLSRSVQARP